MLFLELLILNHHYNGNVVMYMISMNQSSRLGSEKHQDPHQWSESEDSLFNYSSTTYASYNNSISQASTYALIRVRRSRRTQFWRILCKCAPFDVEDALQLLPAGDSPDDVRDSRELMMRGMAGLSTRSYRHTERWRMNVKKAAVV